MCLACGFWCCCVGVGVGCFWVGLVFLVCLCTFGFVVRMVLFCLGWRVFGVFRGAVVMFFRIVGIFVGCCCNFFCPVAMGVPFH